MKKIFNLFFILFLIISMFSACSSDAESGQSIDKEQVAIELAQDVQILYSDSAVLRVKITSDTLLHYVSIDDQRDEFPNGVRLDFFDTKQQPQSILTSKYAIRYPSRSEVVLRDSCVWYSLETKETLESTELIWDEKLQKVYSNKFVIITTPSEKIWGYGFETNSNFTHWKINVPQGHLSVQKPE